MPRQPLSRQCPRTPLARLRREFLVHPDGKRFYQGDLAMDLGISIARVQQLELGREPLPEKHALKLQEIYGISADWLLGGDPQAETVCPNGGAFSRAIASGKRQRYLVKFSPQPSANLARQLALSLESLLAETRATILRTNRRKGLHAAARLFEEMREALFSKLARERDADGRSVSSVLEQGAAFISTSLDENIVHRFHLTQSHLGVDDLPYFDHKGREITM